MSYPTDPEFQAIDFRLNYNNVRSQTRSGRTQVRTVGTALWSFTAKYNDLTRAEFAPVFAFVAGQKGGEQEFNVTPPVISDSRGNASGVLKANGAHSAGDSTISMDGIAGTIKAGDFITFAGHTKVYMCVADFTASGTMTIEPALYESVGNDEIVTYDNVAFTMRLARDIQQFKFSGYERYQFEVDLIEAI